MLWQVQQIGRDYRKLCLSWQVWNIWRFWWVCLTLALMIHFLVFEWKQPKGHFAQTTGWFSHVSRIGAMMRFARLAFASGNILNEIRPSWPLAQCLQTLLHAGPEWSPPPASFFFLPNLTSLSYTNDEVCAISKASAPKGDPSWLIQCQIQAVVIILYLWIIAS